MSAHLYIEGGESKEDQIRCRAGFRKLLERAGFSGRMPRLSACGGRLSAFDDFKIAHARRKVGDYIAMLIDSEDPVVDLEKLEIICIAAISGTNPPKQKISMFSL